MKFCVFTDLHYDGVFDGDRRIAELLQSCKAHQVDFILDLGDLCHPTAENQKVLTALRSAGIPCYFSLGNHNTDFCPPETALSFLGLSSGHYAVVRDNVKFIFLNAIDRGPSGAYIPSSQLRFLERELADNDLFYVICTHQSLANDFVTKSGKPRGIVNRAEVRAILEQRNANGKRVLFCMNGHEHGTGIREIGGIHYYFQNSASYFWQGVKETYPYSREIHEKYPHLKNMVLYREPLHSIVTIDHLGNVDIQGMQGHYLSVTPQDIGMEPFWNGVCVLPETLSLKIPAPSNSHPTP